jgi:hypothetical protein
MFQKLFHICSKKNNLSSFWQKKTQGKQIQNLKSSRLPGQFSFPEIFFFKFANVFPAFSFAKKRRGYFSSNKYEIIFETCLALVPVPMLLQLVNLRAVIFRV